MNNSQKFNPKIFEFARDDRFSSTVVQCLSVIKYLNTRELKLISESEYISKMSCFKKRVQWQHFFDILKDDFSIFAFICLLVVC